MVRLLAVALTVLSGATASGQSAADRPASFWASLATSDGVRATIYRYDPSRQPGGRAILLLPDVGMTRHAFDFGGRGLAPFLQRAGFEVFVLEYRGAGRSQVPFGGYRLEDLLDKDVEAAFARALQGRERIALGGVGLGATFALAMASRHAAQLDSVVALQPLIAPDVPSDPVARLMDGVGEAPPWIDLAILTRAPLFGSRSWFEILFANDGSLDSSQFADLRLHVLAPVPRQVAQQVVQAIRERRVRLGAPLEELVRGWTGRTLLLFAPRDNWIHPEFSVPARELLTQARVEVRVLDPLIAARDYGHLGMLLGREAPEDVFAPILRFLEAQ
jgi:pimeloyl-ACP methyl ester carboxylesterase